MLTNLLPGLRELRAPLAAGYLWLVSAWLIFHGLLSDHTKLVHDLAPLVNWAGKPAVAVAITFGAYLVGILSEATTTWLLRIVARSVPSGLPLGDEGYDHLRELAFSVLDRRITVDAESRSALLSSSRTNEVARLLDPRAPSELRRSVLFDRVDVYAYVASLAGDLALVPARLIGQNSELYGMYDRLNAEAEFRAAVTLPAAVLCVTLGLTESWPFVFGLVLVPVLARQAITRARRSNDILAGALRATPANSPAVDKMYQDGLLLNNPPRTVPFSGSNSDDTRIAYFLAKEYDGGSAADQALSRQWLETAARGGQRDAAIEYAFHAERVGEYDHAFVFYLQAFRLFLFEKAVPAIARIVESHPEVVDNVRTLAAASDATSVTTMARYDAYRALDESGRLATLTKFGNPSTIPMGNDEIFSTGVSLPITAPTFAAEPPG